MSFSEHCTVTATLHRLSSRDGQDSVSTEYDCDNEGFRHYFRVWFYANGSCVENEGHVSIDFSEAFNRFSKPATFSCTASVIDASGNKRFPQSLVLDLEYLYKEDKLFFQKGFGFDKFLKRSTLLGDAPELLPDDCLTLCLEIDYEVLHLFVMESMQYDDAFDVENDTCYLRTDTEFWRDLCEMSSVFRDMMECTIAESGPDRIPIPKKEYDSFRFIHNFLSEWPLRGSLSDICQRYIVGDKYDMQPIVRLCHQLLVSVVRSVNTPDILEYVDEDMHMISELAERFADDERLRQILAIYSDTKKELEGGTGDFDASDACELETEWNCEYMRGKYSFFYGFEFRKNNSELLEIGMY